MIKQEQRKYWDFIIALAIIFSAFEIPFNLLVGYNNLNFEHFLNNTLLALYAFDILLNIFSESRRRFSGLFGWRVLVGVFVPKVSTEEHRKDVEQTQRKKKVGLGQQLVDEGLINSSQLEEALVAQTKENLPLGKMLIKLNYIKPERLQAFLDDAGTDSENLTGTASAKSYLTSGWFIIDLIAVLPYEYFASDLAALELIKLLRLIRLVRLLKMFTIFGRFNRIFSLNPAIGRFIKITIFVPFLMHLIACLLFYFESSNLDDVKDYFDSLHYAYGLFFGGSDLPYTSTPGYILNLIGSLLGFFLFGLFMGNFASYFERVDKTDEAYEKLKEKWEDLFELYPNAFNSDIKTAVLKHAKQRITLDKELDIEGYISMIEALDYNLEKSIRENLYKAYPNKPLTNLLK